MKKSLIEDKRKDKVQNYQNPKRHILLSLLLWQKIVAMWCFVCPQACDSGQAVNKHITTKEKPYANWHLTLLKCTQRSLWYIQWLVKRLITSNSENIKSVASSIVKYRWKCLKITLKVFLDLVLQCCRAKENWDWF